MYQEVFGSECREFQLSTKLDAHSLALIVQVVQDEMYAVKARVSQGMLLLHTFDDVYDKIQQALVEHQDEVRKNDMETYHITKRFCV
jgi:hypothetical protein